MKKEKGDRARLNHILECVGLISEWVEGITKDGFLANKMLQEALIRQMEIIGEATKYLKTT